MFRFALLLALVAGAIAAPLCLTYKATAIANAPRITSNLICENFTQSCLLEVFARFDDSLFTTGSAVTFGADIISEDWNVNQPVHTFVQPPQPQGMLTCVENMNGCDPGVGCNVVITYSYNVAAEWSTYNIVVFLSLIYRVSPSTPITCADWQTWEDFATLQPGSLGLVQPDSQGFYTFPFPPGPNLATLINPCVKPTCGNGVVDVGEQCDGGQCCTTDMCLFEGPSIVCNAFTGALCESGTELCSQPVTNTPTPSQSATSTASASATPTPSATRTPSSSPSTSRSATPSPSAPPTPSNSPTASNTPSNSRTPSTTASASATPTPSTSVSSTGTPSSSPSAPPTPSPSVGPRCEEVCDRYYPL